MPCLLQQILSGPKLLLDRISKQLVDSAVLSTPRSLFLIANLGDIETEFENILASLSGTQMGSSHGGKSGRKCRDTDPLMGYFILYIFFKVLCVSCISGDILELYTLT